MKYVEFIYGFIHTYIIVGVFKISDFMALKGRKVSD
jgi:hypothetical protein